jgi:hypothetical protein
MQTIMGFPECVLETITLFGYWPYHISLGWFVGISVESKNSVVTTIIPSSPKTLVYIHRVEKPPEGWH